MPQFAIELRPTSGLIFTEAYRGAEVGRIESVAVSFPGPITLVWGELFVTVGTMLGGRGYEFITAVFTSSYVSTNNLGGWTGSYLLEPYEEIFAWAKAVTAIDIRIVGKISKEVK